MRFNRWALAVSAALALSGCDLNDDDLILPIQFSCTGSAPAGVSGEAVALSTDNRIVRFNIATLATVSGPTAITGLAAGESVVGLDIRPADGMVYALARNGTTGRLYVIDSAGLATLIPGTITLSSSDASYGVDWNPIPNALRIVGSDGQNLRITAITGAGYTVNNDTATTATGVVASAYTNNFANTVLTTLYNITAAGNLVTQGGVDSVTNPNSGVIANVGSLGTGAISSEAGFDVDGLTGVALAALSRPGAGSSQMFNVDLGTGAATCYGSIPGNFVVRDFSLPRVQPAVAFAVTSAGNLISFPPNAAGVAAPTTVGAVSGMMAGETVIGMDFRPATGDLVAVTNQSRIYTINTTSAAATQSPPAAAQFSPGVSGTSFGIDFNPLPDRIRLISDAEQNLRLNQITGAVAGTDTTLTGGGGDAVAAGYTNNFAGATSTTLFVLDTTTNNLLRQGDIGGTPGSPNAGVLTAVGALGVDPLDVAASFDIIGGRGVTSAGVNQGDTVSYGVLSTTAGASRLHRINLGTGAATSIGDIGGGSQVQAFAVRVTR